jgi:hypothetical protein
MSDSKVRHLYGPIMRHEYVRRFEIPVHQTVLVRVLQRVAHLNRQIEPDTQVGTVAGLNPVPQVA